VSAAAPGVVARARGGRREATKAANRDAILAAAREVFAELDYGTASVRDVVRRTDLATGTFYNYFPDKEAVFRALLEQITAEVRGLLRAARAQARTPEDFVAGGFRAYFAFLARDRRTFELMRRNAGTIRAFSDGPMLGAGTEELAADLRAGVAARVIPEHDVELMAAAMVGAGLEVGAHMVEQDPPDVEAATAFVSQIFLGGLERLGAARAT
jgi:AcrR family transcriptional regulator